MIGISIFVFGLIIGSFLGVVIDRLPTNESIVYGRSRCDTCKRDLTPGELIPLVSFVIQGAKCKQCKTKLSFRYPLIELISGVTFYLVYKALGLNVSLISPLIFTSILIVITFIDIDTMIIYDRFHILILILGLIDAFVFKKNLLHLGIAALIISLPLFIIAVVTGGMGGGDIKLMFAAGFYLGIERIVVAFVIAIVIGGIYAVYTLIKRKHSREDAIPFGPFLCLGLYVSMLYGINISQWYLSLLAG